MKTKLAVVAYLPAPHFGHPIVFAENLKQFPTKNELIMFSPHHWGGVYDVMKIGNPEIVANTRLPNGNPKPYAITNLIFYTGLRMAKQRDITHMLYVEPDCRVGKKGWDNTMFTEFFSKKTPAILGGSCVAYAPFNEDMTAARAFAKWYRETEAKCPIPIYGCKGAEQKGTETMVFTNGALSVIDVNAMCEIFDLSSTVNLAKSTGPWDMEIGRRIWANYGIESFDIVAHLNSAWSTYANVLSTEEERINLVRKGEIVAVHQVKSAATV